MADVLVRRPARTTAPAAVPEPLPLSAPPGSADAARTSNWTYALFPLMGSAGILVFALVNGNPVYLLAGGVFVLGAVGMGAAIFVQTRGRSKEQSVDARRRYLEHLAAVRADLRERSAAQRDHAELTHPDPGGLVHVAAAVDRLWERRPTDDDFLLLRVGRGRVPSGAAPQLGEPDPMQPRDPVADEAAQRLVTRLRTIPDVPVAAAVRGRVTTLVGDRGVTRGLARAVVGQLTAFHAPDEVRLAVAAPDDDAKRAWDWLKWLPHARHPGGRAGGAGALLLAGSADDLVELLAAETERRRAAARAAGGSGEPLAGPEVVVVVDGAVPPPDPLDRLAGLGYTVLHLVDGPDEQPRHVDLGLRLAPGADGRPRITVVPRAGAPVGGPADGLLLAAGDLVADGLSLPEAETLARRLSPLRLSREAGGDSSLSEVRSLASLLGIPDVAALDVRERWAARSEEDLLRLPLGVSADGTPVQLDLKESAQSGMGPHGIAVGATGSGKSELLRTLVSALTLTHAPDDLALVLVDFKGGATFAGMAGLPHVAGSITDLEDDPEMIDRFERALRGELRRREELLRDSGNLVSIREHRRRRLAGADVPPMPHLLVVVDEFSELLVQQPDLIELFVAIGRLGRSLGVHLLLATQRLEEGRIRGLESHLSYRLALKTFTAQESRTLIGNADAFELPPVPGSAYLKVDTSVYERFRVSTVSAPHADARAAELTAAPVRHPRAVWGFPPGAPGGGGRGPRDGPRAARARPRPLRPGAALDPRRHRVPPWRGAADPVHQVWVPPLPAALALDAALPALVTDPAPRAAGRGRRSRPDPAGAARRRRPARAAAPGGAHGRPRRLRRARGRRRGPADGQEQHPADARARPRPDPHPRRGAGSTGSTSVAGRSGSWRRSPTSAGSPGARSRSGSGGSSPSSPASSTTGSRCSPSTASPPAAEFRAGRRDGTLPDDGHGDVVLLVDGWMALRSEFRGPRGRRHAAGRPRSRLRRPRRGHRRALVGHPARPARQPRHEDRAADRRRGRQRPRPAASPGPCPPSPAAPSSRATSRPRSACPASRWRTPTAPRGRPRHRRCTASPRRGPARRPARSGCSRTGSRSTRWPPPPPARPPRRGSPSGCASATCASPASPCSTGRTRTCSCSATRARARPPPCARCSPRSTATTTPEELRVIVVDPRRSLLEVVDEAHLSVYCGSVPAAIETLAAAGPGFEKRLPGAGVTVRELRDRSWWDGPRFVIVADDYDLLAAPGRDPLEPLVDLLAQGADIGLHVVLARGVAAGRRAP